MPCTCPVDCWPAPIGSVNRRPVYSPAQSYPGARSFQRPCGRCVSCRLTHSRDVAVRCFHEASLQPDNVFVTATYDDDHLPSDGSLDPTHHTDFLKRLREYAARCLGYSQVRFFMAAEYGDKLGRPHYHYLLFNLDLPDKVLHSNSKSGLPQYTSPTLERLWGHGFIPISAVTAASAGYVARYALKKVTGDRAADYWRPHPVTGEPFKVLPEFARMSRRPGVGFGWLEQWGSTDLSGDMVIVDGAARPIPRYYVSKLSEVDQAKLRRRKELAAAAPARVFDRTERRLIARHESAGLRAKRLLRELDAGS